MKAMILAAGLSTRLRPHSLLRPKPLFPILNRPLLLLTIARLKKAGFRTIIVNCHHLGEQISRLLQGMDGIIIQPEEEILGTGGGLRRALPHFGDEPVLVTNGDIYHTVDYGEVYHSHCTNNDEVTMVMHDFPRFNKVAIDENSRVVGFDAGLTQETVRYAAFTGIHVINPQVLQLLPAAGSSSIIDCYRNHLLQGKTIRARSITHCFWSDIGTPADYLQLHGELLQGQAPPHEELEFIVDSGPFYMAPGSVTGQDVQMEDWVCIGNNVRVGDNCLLRRVVVWDNVAIPSHSRLEDTIVNSLTIQENDKPANLHN
jgi:mannose-1-phosphate guanylyltransferase